MTFQILYVSELLLQHHESHAKEEKSHALSKAVKEKVCPKFKYTEADMLRALEEVKGGSSVKAAAAKFKVPRTTLLNKSKEKYQEERRMGPPTILSKEEEERIVQWMFTRAKAGFPVTKNNLLDGVSNFLKKIQRPNPFTQGVPGRSWFESFLKRHPNISVRMAQNLTSSRANVTKENLIHWSPEVQHYLQDNNLMEIFEDPSRVFNADEAALFLNPKGSKVLVPRGSKSVYKIVNPDEKECLTVLMNADGTIAPPLILLIREEK